MTKQYLIYADESHKKGEYFSNFYGSAMLEYNKLQKINNDLINKKKELNLFSEVKWNKVTMQYLNKYIELINYFFKYIINGDIKIRIMFRQNAFVPQGLTKEKYSNQYFLLYYQFIKHSYGLDYCNKIFKKNNLSLKLYFDELPYNNENFNTFKSHLLRLNNLHKDKKIELLEEDIVQVHSEEHVILQCMDIILGSINFKLNNMDKIKNVGKTTLAKIELYNVIYYNICKIYPRFNIGISTGDRGNVKNRWYDHYRHWCFKSKNSVFNSKLTKKNKNSIFPT